MTIHTLPAPTRRSLLAAATALAAVPGAVVPATLVAMPATLPTLLAVPDPVLALWERYFAAKAAYDASQRALKAAQAQPRTSADELHTLFTHGEELWARVCELEDEFFRTHAATVPGVVVKLRLWRDIVGFKPDEAASFDDAVMLSVMTDLESGCVAGAAMPLTHAGDDARFLAWETELAGLLAVEFPGDPPAAHTDRVCELHGRILNTPAAGFVGALVKLRRVVCPYLGLFDCGERADGGDLASLRDVMRVIAAHLATAGPAKSA